MSDLIKCKIIYDFFAGSIIWITFVGILRGGAVVARWAHNPKVRGSNPLSATKKRLL